MSNRPGSAVLGHLYRIASGSALADLPDADLLRRFAVGAGAAEAAFAALVRRHGPAVLGVCRSTLGDPCDVEDAFQATFLVLATKVHSLERPAALGPWLYGVARRVSDQARRANARRRRHEHRAVGFRSMPDESGGVSATDMATAVRAAVGRLPDRLRAAVVLCDLYGLTYREAAGRLGWTHAAVRGRLARARQRLRAALVRTGVAPAVAVVAPVAAPAVPPALVVHTARLAARVAAGAAGAIPQSLETLMHGGMTAMFLTKIKAAGLSVLTAAVLVAGACGLSAQDRRRPADPGAKGPAVAVSDADRIARLARAAQLQQEAGEAAGAIETLHKVEAASRVWRDRLRGAGGAGDRNSLRPDEVRQRIEKLQEELTETRIEYEAAKVRAAMLLRQIEEKERDLARLRGQRAPVPEDFRGAIRSIQGDLATITPGSDAGAAVGGELHVYRLLPKPEYLGKLVIQAVTPHEAVGRLEGPAKGRVKANDEVAARLR